MSQEYKKHKNKLYFAWLFVIGYLLFVAPVAHASRFVAEVPKDIKTTPYTISVFIEPEGESINAVQGSVVLPNLKGEPDVRTGNSVLSLWVDKPSFNASTKTLSFSGIMPNGYPGTKGVLLSLVFADSSSAEGIYVSGSAYKNDGRGTEITLSKKTTLVMKTAGSVSLPDISSDHELPESFTPILVADPVLYDGKVVVVFETQDKGSGIDYYEVAETIPKFIGNPDLVWEKTISPYVLKDQSISSDIYIKAVDRNGNVRIEKISPEKWFISYRNLVLSSIIVLILLAVLFYAYRKRRG